MNPLLLVGGRQSGKTHALVQWAKAADDRMIITPFYAQTMMLRDDNPELAGRVHTHKKDLRGFNGEIAVDEALSILAEEYGTGVARDLVFKTAPEELNDVITSRVSQCLRTTAPIRLIAVGSL